MRILWINLRHLYQRKTFLLAELFGMITAWFIIASMIITNRMFTLSAIWVFVYGSFLSVLINDLMNMPFTFCLPGQKDLPVKFLFSIGWIICFIWTMICHVICEYNSNNTALIFLYLPLFSLFTILYWLGVLLGTFMKNRLERIIFAIFLSVFFNLILTNTGLSLIDKITTYPFRLILLNAGVNLAMWWYLNNLSISNINHINPKSQQLQIQKNKYNVIGCSYQDNPGRIEYWFISRIAGSNQASLQRYIWSILYDKLWNWFYPVNRIGFIILFIIAVKAPLVTVIIFSCVLLGLMLGIANDIIYTKSYIKTSRKHRFWSVIILSVTAAAAGCLTIISLSSLGALLRNFLPVLQDKWAKICFMHGSVKLCIIILLIIPALTTISLFFYKKPVKFTIFIIGILFLVIFGPAITANTTEPIITTKSILTSLICIWLSFIAILAYITKQCDLIRI